MEKETVDVQKKKEITGPWWPSETGKLRAAPERSAARRIRFLESTRANRVSNIIYTSLMPMRSEVFLAQCAFYE